MKKRLLSFMLAVAILVGIIPQFLVSADAATQLSYAPYANVEYNRKTSVKCGTIRYVSQISSSKYFYESYWGSTWKEQAGIECGTSCISMALSYIGVNRTPEDILDAGNGETVFGKNWGVSTYKGYNYTKLETAMNRYINGGGKYSPPVIHLSAYSGPDSNHWVMLIGRVDSDTYRVLDPAKSSTWNITIDGYTATYKKPGTSTTITDTIKVGGDDVRQWYNANAKITASIITQPKSVKAFENEYAKVTIKASGNGLTYKWYYKNASSSKFYLAENATRNSYSVKMTEARDGRQLYCVITDQYGNTKTSNTVTVSLAKKATIITQPKSVEALLSEKAKTTVKATGDGLTYQWYYKDPGKTSYTKSTLTGATYSITMSEKRDGRKVYCKITDEYGNTVKTKTVTLTLSDLVVEHLSTNCTIKATAKTYAKSLPCSSSTDASSKTLKTVSKNTTYTATAVVLNRNGNYWYRVKTSDGKTAYLPASKMAFQKAVTTDVEISGVKAPSTLAKGKTYSIKGTIDATRTNITKIAAYVYEGETASGSSVTGGSATVTELPASLSKVDAKVEFNELPAGTYTYAVYAYYSTYYAKTEKTVAKKTGKICLYTKTFTITD